MKTSPILFSAPMVRAILAGKKTQTRRVVKGLALDWLAPEMFSPSYVALPDNHMSPYGYAGDQLWVKETWQYADWTEDGRPVVRYAADSAIHLWSAPDDVTAEKLIDVWADLSTPENVAIDGKAADRKWRPSIFMPRWASRITLEVTEVRVQRLQEIRADDAWAEGVPMSPDVNPVHEYREIWETINGAGSWDLNPWVWVVSFRGVA